MDFLNKLRAVWEKNNSLLCIGLDPDLEKLPTSFNNSSSPQWDFNRDIINVTSDLACAYKPNSAFYEARGSAGIEELKRTCDYLHEKHPDIPIILDFKRGDIGSTNEHYAAFAFDYLGADAVTVQPWVGKESLRPFLDRKDKGIIVLNRTSNTGSGEFQDLTVDGQMMYLKVAKNVKEDWNVNGNCLMVVGATYPEELAEIRKLVGDDMVFLVPGVGAQGGDLEATVKAGRNSQGTGLVISSSRAILYASNGDDFAEAARSEAIRTREEINNIRGES